MLLSRRSAEQLFSHLTICNLHQLLNDNTFINAQSLPSAANRPRSWHWQWRLGMKIVSSPLGHQRNVAFAIDTRVASVMLLRRDVTVEDWEDVKNGKYGVRATTRFGAWHSAIQSYCQNDKHQDRPSLKRSHSHRFSPSFLG